MNDLNQILKQSEGDEQDQLLKKAVIQLLNKDLKKSIIHSLDKNYNIRRNKSGDKNIISKSGNIIWLKKNCKFCSHSSTCFYNILLLQFQCKYL